MIGQWGTYEGDFALKAFGLVFCFYKYREPCIFWWFSKGKQCFVPFKDDAESKQVWKALRFVVDGEEDK